MTRLVVAGVGTNVGKTVVSAVLAQALGWAYWKPIQAGDLHNTDAMTVAGLSPTTMIYPEAVRLRQPASPHAAAEHERRRVTLTDLALPTDDPLVVELAGGLFVPLNSDELLVDLVVALQAPVVLVANYYLGSINHTLLSVEALGSRNVSVLGLVFTGAPTSTTRSAIVDHTGLDVLADIPFTARLTPEFVQRYGQKLRHHHRLATLRS